MKIFKFFNKFCRYKKILFSILLLLKENSKFKSLLKDKTDKMKFALF